MPLIAVWEVLLFAAVACASQTILADHSLQVCSLISFHLPKIVSFPGEQQYERAAGSYWASNQREVRAACQVAVQSSDDVQKVMYLISLTNSPFAIKSGGHSPVANTSNLQGGIIIDLQRLNHVNIDAESLSLDVGAGARWNDVYSQLEKSNAGLVVAGARSGSVGVSGYILGGGLSAAELGFACDQVLFFEAILANGTLVEASKSSHADLFAVLKGGGSNLAVVTRFGLRLFRKPPINFVTLQYQRSVLRDLVIAITQYNADASRESGSAVLNLGSDGKYSSVSLVLTHDDVMHADSFLPFFKIPHTLVSSDHWSQLRLAAYYDSMNEAGFRQSRSTLTVLNDASLTGTAAQDLFSRLIPFLTSLHDSDARGGLLIQPLSLSHLNVSKLTGSNILGLENESQPLLVLLLEVRHSSPRDDSDVDEFVSTFISDLHRNATMANCSHAFKYLNYASADQDVFEHIREVEDVSFTWLKIQETRSRYDSLDVFGRQIKDPFRLHV